MELQHIRTDSLAAHRWHDTPHEVFTDDLLKRYGAEIHRFTNAAGVAYSAIYRGGFEEMSDPREREGEMIDAFRRRLYAERFGAKNAFM